MLLLVALGAAALLRAGGGESLPDCDIAPEEVVDRPVGGFRFQRVSQERTDAILEDLSEEQRKRAAVRAVTRGSVPIGAVLVATVPLDEFVEDFEGEVDLEPVSLGRGAEGLAFDQRPRGVRVHGVIAGYGCATVAAFSPHERSARRLAKALAADAPAP